MKIAVAMSGGIDSSVAAAILIERGHEVIGITARFIPRNELNDQIYRQSVNDAKSIAEHLGFRHIELDFTDIFRDRIIKPFCHEYLSGRTPNPCVVCNRYVKFEELLQAAKNHGCEKLATGHYVMKKFDGNRYFLSMSIDHVKDQSYFLYMLSQEQLADTIFPLAEFNKKSIRTIASEKNLILKDKPDSQEICFIPENDYINFLESFTGKEPQPGNITDSSGKVLGRHNGIYRYTIGQRRGMGISAQQPLYVTGLDPVENRVIAGYKNELNIKYLETLNSFDMKLIIDDEISAFVKCRSTQKPVPCKVKKSGDKFFVTFENAESGISPGQSAVFYDKENDLLGGGIIDRAWN